MKKNSLLTVLALILFVQGCGKNTDEISGKLNVFTSIMPQKYFVERIGGDRVNVSVLVLPGKSPATYEPTPDQVVALSKADLFFSIGVPFEKAFIPSIEESLESLKIVDTSLGIKKRSIESNDHGDNEEHGEHHGEEDHGHSEGAPDPHIWMSPVLVKQQALNIYKALSEKDPEGKDVYKKGYDSFIADLDKADAELKKVLAPFKGSTLFVFHPAFGYFADEYGLKQEAIETGGKEPSPSLLESIIKKAKADKVKVIFVQPEFSKKSAKAIANAINGSVIILNPLNPDYLNNILNIADEVKKVLGK